MSGGTEAFPELGRHCQLSHCHQLDFLPFKCNACQKVFCLEHRSYKSHECPKSDNHSRKVVVCEICSTAIETTGEDNEKAILEKHEKSGNCDPTKKKKPTCPVKRCKEVLTFSNTSVCKHCNVKVCLKHRFPGDHACSNETLSVLMPAKVRGEANKFMAALASRNAKDCGKKNSREATSPPTTPSIKAC
ncbi:RNA metabolism protein [Lithospermum erythrorhizon]|uniref:RNA metabolism protein n=1 Tax=Lithospermum erythrorhizon TaxID=34254 RepID=A0AAV3S1S1_LITER